ncbi:MAG TPA: hypothetical protein VGG13_01030 [Candidatus Saccharimonadales bacterium]|jgi:hypothetical protein
MNKLSKNQKGFGAVETLLVLIIIILIGAVGWLVYKDHHKTTPPAKASTSANTNTPPAQPAKVSTSAATQLLTNFYTKYKACNADQTCTANLVKQYGTANLLSYYKPATGSYAEDPMLCAQTLPDSISVSGVTTTSTSAAGTVTESFASNSVAIKFTAAKQSGSLKIDTVTCDPPARATTTPN